MTSEANPRRQQQQMQHSPRQEEKGEMDISEFSTPPHTMGKSVGAVTDQQQQHLHQPVNGIHKSHSDASSAEYYSADEDQNKDKNIDKQVDNDTDAISLQDALASSTALVGENVIDVDSPSAHAMVMVGRGFSGTGGQLDVPPLQHTCTGTGAGAGAARAAGATTTTTNFTTTAATNKNTIAAAAALLADDESVGMMAQGLVWVRRQREHRQRLYLQNLAQQQLAKIQKAVAAEKEEAAGNSSSRGLLDNSTFASLARSMSPAFGSGSGVVGVGGINLSCGSGSFTGSDDENEEHKGVVSADGSTIRPSSTATSTTISSKYSLKTDRQFARDHQQGSNSSMISKSGDGYTVQLSVSEDEEEEEASWVPPVRVVSEPELERHPYILLADHMQQIAVHVLPRGIAYCQWQRLYSLARDGDSFEACLRVVRGASRTLLVVRTSRNAIFGGFAESPWEPQSSYGAVYFGGPNACLFKVDTTRSGSVEQNVNDDTDSGSSGQEDNVKDCSDQVKHFKWSGANRYIQLCDVTHKMLAFGGGGQAGAFGLCVENDFKRGSTGHCATFDNEPLCDQEDFEIVDMEIFGFLVGQF